MKENGGKRGREREVTEAFLSVTHTWSIGHVMVNTDYHLAECSIT